MKTALTEKNNRANFLETIELNIDTIRSGPCRTISDSKILLKNKEIAK